MKHLFISLSFFLTTTAFSQNKIVSYTVPIDIHNEFMQMNRNSQSVKWIMHDYVYEVQFIQNNKKKRHLYNQAGVVLERREAIARHQLPQKVISYLQNHPNYKLINSELRSSGKQETFALHLQESPTKNLYLIFGRLGNLKQKGDVIKTLR